MSVLYVGSPTAGRDLVNLLLLYILEIAIYLGGIKFTDCRYTDIPSIQGGKDFLNILCA
jgi:hypothetical protein